MEFPTGVSRETRERINQFVDLVLRWQKRMNLIGSDSVQTIWDRHVRDSLQLALIKPNAALWVDLGSGGGFPGLIIACRLADMPGGAIHLVESNQKKAAFLRHVALELTLPAIVHARRIEDVIESLPQPEIVTARALAPLTTLLGYTNLLLKRGAIGLFPKGRDHPRELTEAGRDWHFSYMLHTSLTDPDARIIELVMSEKSGPI
jgi:16S rRNA (guanine527-N7)-methyltransferase